MANDVPEAWPPSKEDLLGTPVVPLFPLPGVFLFPRQLMPLHVFEPRYRQMIEDSLDGPGRIALGSIPEGYALDEQGNPQVSPIAGLGEITHHERVKDGRFLIWLFGLTRVRMMEVGSDRLYRKVRVEPLIESAPPSEYAERLKAAVGRAIQERADESLELPESVELGMLVDVLIQQLEVPAEVMDAMFVEMDVVRRAEMALKVHSGRG